MRRVDLLSRQRLWACIVLQNSGFQATTCPLSAAPARDRAYGGVSSLDREIRRYATGKGTKAPEEPAVKAAAAAATDWARAQLHDGRTTTVCLALGPASSSFPGKCQASCGVDARPGSGDGSAQASAFLCAGRSASCSGRPRRFPVGAISPLFFPTLQRPCTARLCCRDADNLLLYQLFAPFGAVLQLSIEEDPNTRTATAVINMGSQLEATLAASVRAASPPPASSLPPLLFLSPPAPAPPAYRSMTRYDFDCRATSRPSQMDGARIGDHVIRVSMAGLDRTGNGNGGRNGSGSETMGGSHASSMTAAYGYGDGSAQGTVPSPALQVTAFHDCLPLMTAFSRLSASHDCPS